MRLGSALRRTRTRPTRPVTHTSAATTARARSTCSSAVMSCVITSKDNSSYVCPVSIFDKPSSNSTVNCTVYAPDSSWKRPGDRCTIDSECLSGSCSNSTCAGVGLGQSCSPNSDQCGPGLFCYKPGGLFSSAKCVQAIEVGSPCNASVQCVFSARCDYLRGSVCRRKGTVPVGDEVALSDDIDLCSSFQLAQTVNSTYICIPGN